MHYGNLLRILSGSKVLGSTVAIVSRPLSCIARFSFTKSIQLSLIQVSAALVQAGQTIAIKDRFPLSRKSFVSETVRKETLFSGDICADLFRPLIYEDLARRKRDL